MKGQEANFVKRLVIGCAAALVIFIVLVVVAAKTGFLRVEQSLSSGDGDGFQ